MRTRRNRRQAVVRHTFVSNIPDILQSGTVYVCVEYATAVHKCCCGCGMRVVTPLSPTDWRLTYDGISVSLDPSIGNWSFECESHYYIRANRVLWAGRWSTARIAAERTRDRRAKADYYGERERVEGYAGILGRAGRRVRRWLSLM